VRLIVKGMLQLKIKKGVFLVIEVVGAEEWSRSIKVVVLILHGYGLNLLPKNVAERVRQVARVNSSFWQKAGSSLELVLASSDLQKEGILVVESRPSLVDIACASELIRRAPVGC
jgi:hypothetical protein